MNYDGKKPPEKTETLHLRIGQPFNPYKLFTGIFVPEALVRYRGLSCGSKIAYGRLARYAGENGGCWPSIPTLAAEIGIGTTQARKYVHELERKRFIAIEQRPGTSAVYTFLWHEAFAGEIGEKRKTPPLRKTGGVPARKTGGAPLRRIVPLPLRRTGDEESHHQESQNEESHVKESQTSHSEEKTKSNNPSICVDDDENARKRPFPDSPWDELRSEYRAANGGQEMNCQDERWLKEQMELRGITPDALLQLVHANPVKRFHNPMAGLKWLVKKFQAKTHSAGDLEAVTVCRGASSRPMENPRCEACSNSGRILLHVEGGSRPRVTSEYCNCQMGKDLQVVEKRKQKATASSGNSTEAA
jgi:hypothetical protein